VTDWDPQAYGLVCAPLLKQGEPGPLGPGGPDESVRSALEKLDPRSVVGDEALVDREMATCCMAGLWLRHGFLAESHAISQGVPTQSGSYWHGIMHRREPDYDNAKYWFRRVGSHPVFPPLQHSARAAMASRASRTRLSYLTSAPNWDPFAFIDACQSIAEQPGPDELLGREIAEIEWQLLFDFCYRRAVGAE
jgi:hypothetical protein